MAFISFYTRVAEHRTRFVCLGETPSPRVRCLLALVTYLLTCLQICTLDALACFTLTEAAFFRCWWNDNKKREKEGRKRGKTLDCTCTCRINVPSKYLRHYTGCLARASALAIAPAPSVRCACYL
jgi:hypothetical protein